MDVGISNIKLYGKEITEHNKRSSLDKQEDDGILYICGHRDGYDNTPLGYMIKEYKFIEIATYMINKHPEIMEQPILLSEKDVEAIIYFLLSLEEKDILGSAKYKVKTIHKWIEELLNVIMNHSIEIYIELYEYK